MLLELQHVIKRFHDKELLHIPVWQIHQGQRIGLIGANGCGKTTLLRILQGVCVVEEGVVRRFCTLSYFEQLSQQVSYGDGRLLRELSVSHLQSKKQVSGGEQQRLRLSKALSTPCHLYLLDEPTNYLDLPSIRCITKLLQNYEGSVLFVSHDAAFIKEVATEVWELREHALSMPQDCVKSCSKKQGQIDPDIATKRMILDMRRSEVAHRLIQASGDREVLEKEYAEIMEKLKNL